MNLIVLILSELELQSSLAILISLLLFIQTFANCLTSKSYKSPLLLLSFEARLFSVLLQVNHQTEDMYRLRLLSYVTPSLCPVRVDRSRRGQKVTDV